MGLLGYLSTYVWSFHALFPAWLLQSSCISYQVHVCRKREREIKRERACVRGKLHSPLLPTLTSRQHHFCHMLLVKYVTKADPGSELGGNRLHISMGEWQASERASGDGNIVVTIFEKYNLPQSCYWI